MKAVMRGPFLWWNGTFVKTKRNIFAINNVTITKAQENLGSLHRAVKSTGINRSLDIKGK
jgi:hypothetical protein